MSDTTLYRLNLTLPTAYDPFTARRFVEDVIEAAFKSYELEAKVEIESEQFNATRSSETVSLIRWVRGDIESEVTNYLDDEDMLGDLDEEQYDHVVDQVCAHYNVRKGLEERSVERGWGLIHDAVTEVMEKRLGVWAKKH